jgi:hypothetical protein
VTLAGILVAQPTSSPEDTGIPATPLTETRSLPAGRYTRAGFEPRITLEVADPAWAAVQLFDGFFDIQQDVGSPDVIAIQFARPTAVFGAALAVVPASTAAEAVAALESNPSVTIVASGSRTIDGSVRVELTLDTKGDTRATVMRLAPGDLQMDPARRMRIVFVDAPAGLLAIVLGGSVAKWDAAVAAAEPVLASVTIGR